MTWEEDLTKPRGTMNNPKIKFYHDGTTGNYIGRCSQCGDIFMGHKMDRYCGDCDPSTEYKEVNKNNGI